MKIYDFKKIKDIKTGTKIKILLLISLIVLIINYLVSLSNHLDFKHIDRDEITETISSVRIVIRKE